MWPTTRSGPRPGEFQAPAKIRPAAGDLKLGARYVDAVSDFVWSAAARENFVDDVQAMRRRVEEHIPEKQAAREIKLGRGGLRAMEFAVQILQLVHGRSDVTLRSPTTPDGAGGVGDLGLCGQGGRGRDGVGLSVPAHPGAPRPAAADAPHPSAAGPGR